MALKLSTPYFGLQKVENFFYLATRGFGTNYFRKCTAVKSSKSVHIACSHKSPSFDCKTNWKGRYRFIHVGPVSCGKIVPYKLSDIGEGIVEVVIKEWFIKPGDNISQFDPICEVQSDKASVTISSRYDGIVKKLCHEVDAIAKVGEPLIDIELIEEAEDEEKVTPESSDSKPNNVEVEAPQESEKNIPLQSRVLASPSVRRLAKEKNIDIQKIKGSGKFGQIVKEDVLSYLNSACDSTVAPSTSLASVPSVKPEGQDIVQEIKGIQKAMVKSMIASWNIPLFSYCDEVDVGQLVSLKEDLKRLSQSNGVKITFMPFFIKAASLALNKYPILNSAPDENCEKLTIKHSHNISVAIDTPHGLVVPNIKSVQKLNIIEIARELNRLQDIAAKGQLGLDDLNGGTFTLSNIGIIGGTYTKPLLVPPQVIIGAIGKVQIIPRFDKNRSVVEAHIFNISWTADHRVLDGATVARFSNLWKLYLEHPQLLLHL